MSKYFDIVTGAQKVYLSDADVAEVVRCKNCKWAGRDEHCPAIEVYIICGDDGYCSCGERKEQEND